MTQTISASAYFEEKDRNAVNTPIRVASTLATDYTGVREYIGARYVPIFADPVEWNQNLAYEPLTIVTYAGNSYTSRQYVPKGVLINNTEYWVPTGNFNGQLELYRKEVADLSDDLNNEVQNRTNADTALSNRITTNANAISTETTNRQNADTTINNKLSKFTLDGVSNVTFNNGGDKGYLDLEFEFSNGSKRKIRFTDHVMRYFNMNTDEIIWDTLTERIGWYPLPGVTDLRCAIQNNVFVCDLSGFEYDWVKTETADWQQIATQEQMRIKIGGDVYNAYAVANVNYESGQTATLRLDNSGLWIRCSGTESGRINIYGSIVFLAYIADIEDDDALNPASMDDGNPPFWVVRA